MARRKGVLAVPPASSRCLRIFSLDPLGAGEEGHSIPVSVPYEPLRPGPVGERIEVLDYDPAVGAYYSPVDLDDPNLLAQDGLAPSESDPRFHQQMAYAVAMTTLQRFELALGRRLGFGPRTPRLRIYPHGTTEANAYFSPDLGGLVFGYFRASRRNAGQNLPGGYVFTCLSHDIVAHETAHALVHGLREKFMEASNPDTPAFHEAFADLVALLQRFSLPGVVEKAIQATRASLDDIAPLVNLGRQFQEAIGTRGALRSAVGRTPDAKALDHAFEPHDRGSILVAAVFAAMACVYRKRTRDLLRIATGGSGVLPAGHIAPDLVKRLANEAGRTARHFLNICIRGLDYCPPVDIEFGDFLRAIITADRELAPEDPWGYRASLIESFRARGIVPQHVFSLAEDSVVWQSFEETIDFSGINFEAIRFHRPPSNRREARAYRATFEALLGRPRNREALRLAPRLPVEIRAVQPLRRIAPDRRIHNEVLVEVMQTGKRVARYDGAPPYRAGTTLIFSETGRIRYSIGKAFHDREREERQRAYTADLAALVGAHAYRKPHLGLSLARIHRGL